MLHAAENTNDKDLDIRSEEGFEKVYRMHSEKLCALAISMVGDISLAENIVHDVFLSIWNRRDHLVVEGPMEHYLTRAVKLAAMDSLRKKALHQKKLVRHFQNREVQSHCTEERLNFESLRQHVGLLVGKLPSKCREIFHLSREMGWTNRKIAATLLISERTVEAHLYKALKFLKKNLSEQP
ncbi:RNA polymerase sigma-70 factor [Echinicola soli]|uniref:RNA polymerase sigma-70 factor n=1 Tax=Echinicola soli TaxID=2591634 RepID=A0A514CND6_9BACT|nr:RNA polymerase sigma-70 factor [Echinicola soli]QDH81336.1 RNA polymerase sigma-70 factor [Echinicola soli]